MVIPENKPIVLLGFMGSGKSTLGKQLASSMHWAFVDLDRQIESVAQKSIPEIFRQDGEAAFRKFESEALAGVISRPCQVIAVGGGAPCQPENLEVILRNSLSVYLKISEAQLLQRLAYSPSPRPLLDGKSEAGVQSYVSELLAQREIFYLQADLVIESDSITVAMILSELGVNPI